jgi:arylsulfatase
MKIIVIAKFVRHCLLLLLIFGCGAASAKPNILLIYVDDLGYGDLGVFGHPVIKTPNLDELANSGLTLTNYHAPSAICSASRAGLLTGRTPYRTGIESWIPDGSGIYLRSEEVTLAEVLKAAGYATALIGKWHLNSDLGTASEPQPMDQGFDYFYGHNAFQLPTNHNPTNIYRNGVALGLQTGYTAQLYADQAIGWLSTRDRSKQFFMYLSMAEPHTTFENPQEFNEIYSDFTNGKVIPIPNGSGDPPFDKLIPRGPGEYYANITYLDSQLGRVLQALEDENIADDTVVVFASDNGPVTSNWLDWWEVNAYGSTGGYRGRKHFLYEGGIRVPAIIRYPGVTKAASSSDEFVIGMDLFTTLALIGGGDIPQDRPIDGVDIGPALSGGTLPSRSAFWALSSYSELKFAVRRGRWKLLLDGDHQPKELYDLSRDPLELVNRLTQEEQISRMLTGIFEDTMASIESDVLRPHR